MEFFFIYHLADAIGQIFDHMNEELGYMFWYDLNTGQTIPEGEYALPLHTDDLWGTCLWVMQMTQDQFDRMMLQNINDQMMRYAH